MGFVVGMAMRWCGIGLGVPLLQLVSLGREKPVSSKNGVGPENVNDGTLSS